MGVGLFCMQIGLLCCTSEGMPPETPVSHLSMCRALLDANMGWLRLVGSFKL